MSDQEPESEDLDAGWDEDVADMEEAPPTPAAEPLELRALTQRAAAPASSPPRRGDLPTLPPPLPASEYVATMMGQPEVGTDAPEARQNPLTSPRVPTLAERHRAILQTLHEEDPLRFDFDDEPVGDRHAA